MKPSHILISFTLIGAALMLSLLMAIGNEAVSPASGVKSAASVENKAGQALSRAEMLPLQAIARRTQSMMEVASYTPTRVWPHGVRDQQGRLGLFLSSTRPLFSDPTPENVQAKQAWVVFGLVAAVKYSEGSQIRHIAFTDSRGETGERWYYDISMAEAREIHGMMIRGILRPENAFKLIEAAWVKITTQHEYAVN